MYLNVANHQVCVCACVGLLYLMVEYPTTNPIDGNVEVFIRSNSYTTTTIHPIYVRMLRPHSNPKNTQNQLTILAKLRRSGRMHRAAQTMVCYRRQRLFKKKGEYHPVVFPPARAPCILAESAQAPKLGGGSDEAFIVVEENKRSQSLLLSMAFP